MAICDTAQCLMSDLFCQIIRATLNGYCVEIVTVFDFLNINNGFFVFVLPVDFVQVHGERCVHRIQIPNASDAFDGILPIETPNLDVLNSEWE